MIQLTIYIWLWLKADYSSFSVCSMVIGTLLLQYKCKPHLVQSKNDVSISKYLYVYQGQIQEFQNQGRGPIAVNFGGIGIVLLPIHKYPIFL